MYSQILVFSAVFYNGLEKYHWERGKEEGKLSPWEGLTRTTKGRRNFWGGGHKINTVGCHEILVKKHLFMCFCSNCPLNTTTPLLLFRIQFKTIFVRFFVSEDGRTLCFLRAVGTARFFTGGQRANFFYRRSPRHIFVFSAGGAAVCVRPSASVTSASVRARPCPTASIRRSRIRF